MIERAEALGFDSVWLRCRHLQPGISSPVAIMAAASQRTSRIELGTAVIPLGSGEPVPTGRGPGHRGHPVGRPDQPRRVGRHADALRPLQGPRSIPTPTTSRTSPRSGCCDCCAVFAANRSATSQGTVGIEQFTDRIQPHSPGLADRVWYGGGMTSAMWAGEQGINYLTSSVVSTERHRVARLRHHPGPEHRHVPRQPSAPRKGACLTGSGRHPDRLRHRRADPPLPRVRGEPVRADQDPAGPARHAVLPRLRRHAPTNSPTSSTTHAGFQRADEVAFALPFTFAEDDYRQIITDLAESLGPRLGWEPADSSAADRR